MAYEYEDFIDAMRFGLTMSDRDNTDDIWKMVDEVVNKARAFDEILDIDLAQHDEEYADNVMKVVNKYTEDKQND